MTANVLVLSGPNLDLLGTRQPSVYGARSLVEHVAAAVAAAEGRATVEHLQSSNESDLVHAVHAARGRINAIVVNAGALTHYGWSLHDALAAFDGVIVEIHISNTAKRERWRHTSVISPVADAVLGGMGRHAYALGVDAALRLLDDLDLLAT